MFRNYLQVVQDLLGVKQVYVELSQVQQLRQLQLGEQIWAQV